MRTLLALLLSAIGLSCHSAQQIINVGASANDGTGDSVRAAMMKVNTNFTELYGGNTNGQFLFYGDTNVLYKKGKVLTAGTAITLVTNANQLVISSTAVGGGGLSSVPSGSVIYVRTNGVDLTAARGDQGKPYLTLNAVKAVKQPGDIIDIGPGTFYVDACTISGGTPLLTNNMAVKGAGRGFTTIVLTTIDTNTVNFFPVKYGQAHDGLLFEDFTLHCNATGYGYGVNGSVSGLNVYGNNILVRNVEIKDFGGSAAVEAFGLLANVSTNGYADSLYVHSPASSYHSAITLASCRNWTVRHYLVDASNVGVGVAYGNDNISILDGLVTNATYGFNCDSAGGGITRLSIVGNSFLSGAAAGTGRGIQLSSGQFTETRLSDNTLQNYNEGIVLTNATGEATNYFVNTVIQDNRIAGGTIAISLQNCTNAIVTGNRVGSAYSRAFSCSSIAGADNTDMAGGLSSSLPNDSTLYNQTIGTNLTVAGGALVAEADAIDLAPSSAALITAPTITMTGDLGIFGSVTIPTSDGPTIDAAGEIGFDSNAYGGGRGTMQLYDGTDAVYVATFLASDTPGVGQVLKYNSSGYLEWSDDQTSTGGEDSVTVDGAATVNPNFDDAGDINFTYSSPNITAAVKAAAISNAKLAAEAENTIKGRVSSGSGDPEDLTPAQTLSVLESGGVNVLVATEIDTSAELASIVTGETGSGALVFGTTPTFTISLTTPIVYSASVDPADSGVVRLGNSEVIAWESAPAGSDVTLLVDAAEILQASGTFNASTLTEGGNAVPNSGDNLGFFSTTTSAQLAGVLGNETGSGLAVFNTAPYISAPTTSGRVNVTNNFAIQESAMPALAVDVTKLGNTRTITADATLTFSGTPTAYDLFGVVLTSTAATNCTITIPASFSEAAGSTRTSFTLKAGTVQTLQWKYDGSVYRLYGDPVDIADLNENAAPGSTNYAVVWNRTTGTHEKVQLANFPSLVGAPASASYVVASANGSLSDERVATDSATVGWDFGTPGQAGLAVIAQSIGDAQLAETIGFGVGTVGNLKATNYLESYGYIMAGKNYSFRWSTNTWVDAPTAGYLRMKRSDEMGPVYGLLLGHDTNEVANVQIAASGARNGTDTDIAGGSLRLRGGAGTGAGNGGSVVLSVSPPATTGTATNAMQDVLTASGTNGTVFVHKGMAVMDSLQFEQASPSAHSSVTNFVLNLVSPSMYQLSPDTNNVTFLHATNAAAGRWTTFLFSESTNDRYVRIPATWFRRGIDTTGLVTVTNGTMGALSCYCYGSDNTNIIATYSYVVK